MNLNKKGFTLTELIAVIVILAILALVGIPAYNTIRRQTMERQYENLVSLIETEATKYAASTGTNLTNVQELINEGILEPDGEDEEGNPIIFDPRDNSSMNCLLIEIEYQNDSYNSKLTDVEDCNLEAVKIQAGTIKIAGEGWSSGNTVHDFSNWQNEDILLYVDTTNLSEKETIIEYNWQMGGAIGTSSNEEYVIISTSENIINAAITVTIKCASGNTYTDKLVDITNLKIDKKSPVINDVSVTGTTSKDITIKAKDTGSGIYGYYIGTNYCHENTNYVKNNSNTYNVTIPAGNIVSGGNYYVCVKDNVGNVTQYDGELILSN